MLLGSSDVDDGQRGWLRKNCWDCIKGDIICYGLLREDPQIMDQCKMIITGATS